MKVEKPPRGLSEREAKERLKRYGKNVIKREKKRNWLDMLIEQFESPIILLLIFAAIISLIVNHLHHESYFDSILILIIVLAAAGAGFIQDYKAERAVEALRRMAAPKARVIRDGKEKEIRADLIVPGDVLVLESGDVIPADAEIIQDQLEVDESILTGESKAVKKKKGDMVYSGCPVYIGNALAIVKATGMSTKIGKLAKKMQEIETGKTPFQEKMESFTKKLVALTGVIIIITFFVGLGKFGLLESFMIAVSLAVAAIPEDLPAVITIALSLGAKEMVRRNALVRRLAITESVGSVDVICTDKTGTITLGKMKVTGFWFPEVGLAKKGNQLANQIVYFCNNAKAIIKDGEERWVGDETDIALKEYAIELVSDEGKRVYEIPFSSERKMMTVVQRMNGRDLVFTKGAPEVILERCDFFVSGKLASGKSEGGKKLTNAMKQRILRKNEELASKGKRILALAYKELRHRENRWDDNKTESELIFVGFVVLEDPPRPEVKKAVQEVYSAGIDIVIITGDNPLTAKAIAESVGIKSNGMITGDQLDKMTYDEIASAIESGTKIFARTDPFHKLKILEALKENGHVVAMTGDGVNDSLALKKADVGVAMGIRGTEVAKEASDIILLDDNFATIRNAIKEGRRIFDNIRKFVDYLLTCNVAEVMVVLIATAGLPFISLYPVQILWINLITDGLPALALSFDPPRPDVMKRKPRPKNEGIINKKLAMLIGGIGIKKSLVIFGTFLAVLPLGEAKARTVLFTAFIMYEFVRIAVIRYNEKLVSLKDWLANKLLVTSLLASLGLQLILIYSPLGKYFKVVPLGVYEWSVLIAGTLLGFVLGIAIAWAVDRITNDDY